MPPAEWRDRNERRGYFQQSQQQGIQTVGRYVNLTRSPLSRITSDIRPIRRIKPKVSEVVRVGDTRVKGQPSLDAEFAGDVGRNKKPRTLIRTPNRGHLNA